MGTSESLSPILVSLGPGALNWNGFTGARIKTAPRVPGAATAPDGSARQRPSARPDFLGLSLPRVVLPRTGVLLGMHRLPVARPLSLFVRV